MVKWQNILERYSTSLRDTKKAGSWKGTCARSYAHATCDTPETRGIAGSGLHQKEERNSDSPKVRWTTGKFYGQGFWARGYYMSTIDRNEKAIKQYIRGQEAEDKRLEQLVEMFKDN